MKIKKFNNFQVKEIFNFKKKLNKQSHQNSLDKTDLCVVDILNFLKENGIKNWKQFINTGNFNRSVIDSIIDSNCDTMEELKKVKYKIRLKISDIKELQEMLREYEQEEEYEKCSEIKEEIESRKTI